MSLLYSEPDAPGSSFLALRRRRKILGKDLRAHVYRYDSKTFLITSINYSEQGPQTEAGPPTLLSVDCSNEDLGRAVCEHVLAYEFVEWIADPHTKRTEWPIFKVSGAKSVKSFESKCLYATIVGGLFDMVIEARPYRRLSEGN